MLKKIVFCKTNTSRIKSLLIKTAKDLQFNTCYKTILDILISQQRKCNHHSKFIYVFKFIAILKRSCPLKFRIQVSKTKYFL